MRKQYLHLSAYSCDECQGPVVSGSIGIREDEISKETEMQQVGAICLACGQRQSKASGTGLTRHFPPTQWESGTPVASPGVPRRVEMLSR